MAKVTCKAGVRLYGLSAGLCRILTVLEALSRLFAGHPNLPSELVITSISDGKHMTNSRHYKNEALDLRAKNFPTREAKRWFRATFEEALGPKFRVLLEAEGTANEHFHAQVRKGGTYP